MKLMKTFLAIGLALAISACGGGGGEPLPPITPIPPAAPAPPGDPITTGDFSAPLAASGGCGGSPFVCNVEPGAQWGLLQASDITHFTAKGIQLDFATDPNAGMALISTKAVLDPARVMGVRETVRIDSLNCGSVAYTGPVIYAGGVDDGDPTGRYRALYISCFPGDPRVQLWMYSPTWAGPVPGGPFLVAMGSTHTLGIDWYSGDRVVYTLDELPVWTEDQNFGHDPLTMPRPGYPSMWYGSAKGSVLKFEARN